eukprot:jgi/Bigna1/145781/aug1.103_g20489
MSLLRQFIRRRCLTTSDRRWPRCGFAHLSREFEASVGKYAANPALSVPQQSLELSYEKLHEKVLFLASALTSNGYGKESGILIDLPNTAENLILQLACSRVGVTVITTKDPTETLTNLLDASNCGAAVTESSELMGKIPVEKKRKMLPPVVVTEEDMSSTASKVESLSGTPIIFENATREAAGRLPDILHDPSDVHAMFGAAKLTHESIIDQGRSAKDYLAMEEADSVCVSITLCHAFGIASAVSSTLMAGGTVVLPAVGGIRGCGNPNQRAEVTLSVLKSEACTLLFADSHTLKALPPPQPNDDLSKFRGGVVKIGSGAEFLEDVTSADLGKGDVRELVYAGERLVAFGKRK